MPDILGNWDRRADDPGYLHDDSRGRALYKYKGKIVTYNERENLIKKDKKSKKKMNNKQNKLEEAVYVSWEESERGWGTRPDGCSLHLTEKDYNRFFKNYCARLPKEVPDEYSRPASSPTSVLVNSDLYKQIKNSKTKYGLRLFEDEQRQMEKKKYIEFKTTRQGWVPIE